VVSSVAAASRAASVPVAAAGNSASASTSGRSSGAPLLRRSGLRPRHRPGPTAERRAPQLAPGPTEAIPQTRTIDGLLRLRYPPRPGPAH
jgi:hypothetical protein